MWTVADDLTCDTLTCTEVYADRGSRTETLTGARARGWHVYDGPTMGGKDLIQHLCPECVGTSSRLPKVKHFDDEQMLW